MDEEYRELVKIHLRLNVEIAEIAVKLQAIKLKRMGL